MSSCVEHPNYIEAKKRALNTVLDKKIKRIENYNSSPNLCIECKKPISYENRTNSFCSHSCAGKHNNRNRIITKKEAYTNCVECGNKLNRTSKRQYKFCSQKCCTKFRVKQNRKDLLNSSIISGYVPTKRYKDILIETFGNRCSICSMSAVWESKPLVLILDHIDGNSDNNNLNNIRLVCPNCDSQLPTFKGRNRGKGRFNRRQRYIQNKSY